LTFFFEKYTNINFHENLSSESQVVQCGQAEERTDVTMVTVAFRNFANAPKTHKIGKSWQPVSGFESGNFRKRSVATIREAVQSGMTTDVAAIFRVGKRLWRHHKGP